MAKTIGNPLTWTARHLSAAGEHLAEMIKGLGGKTAEPPQLRTLEFADLEAALRAGWQDFLASRTDAMFIVLIYPIAGLILMGFGLQMDLLPLLFPLMAGFALLGPVAAVGLYEISRRREAGEEANWLNAIDVFRAPSFGAILVLGIYLAALFVAWMLTANAIYAVTLGPAPPASIGQFVRDVLTTGAGWMMIIVGVGIGFLFALVALAISVVSFPLLLDRKVGVPVAIVTSVRLTKSNPQVILGWGAIVAGGLVLGALPLMLGLIVVLPVLGHATWHLYRRAVV